MRSRRRRVVTLFQLKGAWVTVYLDATWASENADHEVQLRWQALRSKLLDQGADQATVDAVTVTVEEHPYQPGQYGLAIFANAGEVVLLETLSASETFPLRKVNVGGWSHRHYQSAVEEAWKRNATDVGAAAVDLAEAVGAQVIVVGGDVRAVQTFTDRLPRRWRDRLVSTDAGSRHAGADESTLDDVTIQAIAEVAERHVREAVDRYGAQRGADEAGIGLADVATRLQRGQVDTVLLVNDPSSTDMLWIAPDGPTLIAVDERVLRESGVDDAQRVRADAALVLAAAGTGANLVLVSPGQVQLEHGIGAVLRYADARSSSVMPR